MAPMNRQIMMIGYRHPVQGSPLPPSKMNVLAQCRGDKRVIQQLHEHLIELSRFVENKNPKAFETFQTSKSR